MKAGKENKSGETKITGTVVVKKFGEGSKSDHDAIYIETDEGSYVLKRMGGNPFSDPVLKKLVGKTVIATGVLDQYQFIAKNIEEDS